MITTEQISKKATNHIMYCVYIIAAIYLIVLVFGFSFLGDYQSIALIATSVASCISLIESIAVTKIWSWVARKHKDSLPTFYTACSGFRMLFALIVLTIIYFIVGADAMIPFFIAFFVLYFVMLAFHSLFFSRMSNKLFEENTNNE